MIEEGDAVKERMIGRAGATSCSAPPRQPEVPSASASAATRPPARYDHGACIIPPGSPAPEEPGAETRGNVTNSGLAVSSPREPWPTTAPGPSTIASPS